MLRLLPRRRFRAALLVATATVGALTACSSTPGTSGGSTSSSSQAAGPPTELVRGIGEALTDLTRDAGTSQTDWRTAARHIGERRRVCGPVLAAYSDRGDTWIDLGEEHSDVGTFMIVVRNAPPLARRLADPLDRPSLACVRGRIRPAANGGAQIVARSAKAVQFSED